MKFSEISKKLGVALLTGAVVVSMAGMNVSANEVNSISKVDITKKVTTDGNTYAPDTTFNFKVTPGTGVTKYGNDVVYDGVEGGLQGKTQQEDGSWVSQITFTPGDSTSASYSEDGELTVDTSVFTKPGVYHYVVEEMAGVYEGITYSTVKYDVYLYVYQGASGFYSDGVVVVEQGKDAKSQKIEFTNDYGLNNDGTHDVTITKNITGNQADVNGTYTFTVTVTGADNANEAYKVIVKGKAGDQGEESKLVSGEAKTITLGQGGSIQIFGLSEGDTYSVIENEANTDGYTLTVKDETNTTFTKVDNGISSGTVSNDAANVLFENKKEATTPTGVIMNIAPYALMVALAGVLAFFFLRRRHSEI